MPFTFDADDRVRARRRPSKRTVECAHFFQSIAYVRHGRELRIRVDEALCAQVVHVEDEL